MFIIGNLEAEMYEKKERNVTHFLSPEVAAICWHALAGYFPVQVAFLGRASLFKLSHSTFN